MSKLTYTPYKYWKNKTFREAAYFRPEDVRTDDARVDGILGYFENKTQGRGMPKRSDINPTEIVEYLPEIIIMTLQYDDNSTLQDMAFDLVGTKMVSFYGELTNTLLSEHPSKHIREQSLKSAQACVTSREPLIVTSETLSDKEYQLGVTVLYVPLSENGDVIDRLFTYIQVTQN